MFFLYALRSILSSVSPRAACMTCSMFSLSAYRVCDSLVCSQQRYYVQATSCYVATRFTWHAPWRVTAGAPEEGAVTVCLESVLGFCLPYSNKEVKTVFFGSQTRVTSENTVLTIFCWFTRNCHRFTSWENVMASTPSHSLLLRADLLDIQNVYWECILRNLGAQRHQLLHIIYQISRMRMNFISISSRP